ncbi:hypothetical protein SAY87_007837 [Trapa incisa]|uniref:Gag1-like clamp domain-containing protein n=2 Tax=Trapa TaxID=22665 RepID=A0AAN7L0Y5_TRANT|nr:hypothetical protein SAY87_007837 [Trapa incisa]KAK4776876.1 hypothetical protein SAY86_005564 [Trapa natans]
MDVTIGCSHLREKKPALESPSVDEGKNCQEKKDLSATAFVNQAAITWHENRRKWIGDQPRQSEKSSMKDPIISWSMTYDELLSTDEPFSGPIPLQEMVDFLVDIWHDEGLFD